MKVIISVRTGKNNKVVSSTIANVSELNFKELLRRRGYYPSPKGGFATKSVVITFMANPNSYEGLPHVVETYGKGITSAQSKGTTNSAKVFARALFGKYYRGLSGKHLNGRGRY